MEHECLIIVAVCGFVAGSACIYAALDCQRRRRDLAALRAKYEELHRDSLEREEKIKSIINDLAKRKGASDAH